MHLSDSELLEISDEQKSHLAECELCRDKAKVLFEIRGSLTQSQQYTAAPPPWQEVKQSLQAAQKEQQVERAEKRTKFWQFSSFALAASLATVVILQGITRENQGQQVGTQESQLIALINNNKQLQQQVAFEQLTPVEYKALQIQLKVVDKALQQAYLQELTEEEKTELWQQRLLILERSLADKNESKVIRI